MAIRNDLELSQRLKLTDAWDGNTGTQVEDLISRHLPYNIEYNKDKEELHINNYEGESIASGKVTFETPSYLLGILILGIRINGEIHTNKTTLVTLYNSNTKIELAVAAYSVAKYSTSIVDSGSTVSTTITFGTLKKVIDVDPINYELCTVKSNLLVSINLSLSDWNWYDITDLFKSSLTSLKITATAGTATSTLDTLITNLVVSLKYSGEYITSNGIAFTLQGGNTSNYHLEGFNNTALINTDSGVFTLDLLNSGLNLLAIRAVYNTESSISTDYLYVNIIYTNGFDGTAIAINGISEGINNNDTSLIYILSVYSSDKEAISIKTYLEDEMPSSSNPNPTLLLDLLSLTAQSYTNNIYKESFSKYIEINSENSYKYLMVKVDDSWYSFYTVSNNKLYSNYILALLVSAINTDYIYTANPSITYDLIVGRSTTIFNSSDSNWTTADNRIVYRVEANSGSVFNTPLSIGAGNYFSLEFGLKSFNVSGEDLPIITIGPMEIRPTTVCWKTDDTDLYNARNSLYRENVDTHIIITVHKDYRIDKTDPYYPNYLDSVLLAFDNYSGTFNLVRIYINGIIDREIILADSEFNELQNATILINPTTADLDLYLLRAYNTKALDYDEVLHNYISFLKEYTEKEVFFNANDIVDDDGTISFRKSLGKYNTLVYVYPKDGRFPNRSWAGEDNTSGALDTIAKKLGVTLFINYKDSSINNTYGGRITKGLSKGLGSSAMRYLIWNNAYLLNKMKDNEGNSIKSIFTPYSLLITETNKFKENPDTIKGYYNMPNYSGLVDTAESTLKVTKLVGKVNFASSMQSHKEGACKLFNDAYKKNYTTLISGGRKAVLEETFLYFYVETDLESVDDIELADLIDSNSENYIGNGIKFMGVLTWGSAKGDNATYGYDKNKTPEYLLLEGGENTDLHVLFRRPWLALQRGTGTLGNINYHLANNPTVTSAESKEEPWKNLLIIDESITYDGNRGAWDIDYGVEEVTDDNGTYYLIMEKAKTSLKKFREFLDFVYTYDYTLTESRGDDVDSWNLNNKYVVTSSKFSGFTEHKPGDVYRYDDINNTWVAAGTEYDNGWSRLNIYTLTGETLSTALNIVLNDIKSKFQDGILDYIDVGDVAYHLAFIRFLSGTDNRAKNTYFLIIGKIYDENSEGIYETTEKGDYKVRFLGDDLDTIIITDNNGLLSKAYNLIEPSYDSSTANLWGDNGLNKFFFMFDQCFEPEIKNALKYIIQFAFNASKNLDETNNYFYKTFYAILKERIPAVAYNHFSKIYYEAALQVLNSGAIGAYRNNGINPIELSHGACVEGEMQFMAKRYAFLASYAQTNMGGAELETTASAGSGDSLKLRIAFTPFLDFYPSYMYELNTYNYYGEFNKSDYDIIKYKAKADKEYVVNIKLDKTAINLGLTMLSCFKKIDITGLKRPTAEASFARVTNFTIDNNNLITYKSFFGDDFTALNISKFGYTLPVVEELNLKNIVFSNTLDLSKFTKLKTLDLSGSTVKKVILPSSVKTVTLPASIETFELYNPIDNITFEGYSNLKTIELDSVGDFNISEFLINVFNESTPETVILRNLNNVSITNDVITRLLSINTTMTGSITIVNESGNMYSISYDTKLALANKFGNIDSDSNKLKINYNKTTVTEITCESEVYVYGEGYSGNPFNVLLNGNNINLIEKDGYYYPNLKYTASGNFSSIATLDSVTGIITMKVASATNNIKVTISATLPSGSVPSVSCTVYFAWLAPQVGLFMYADGTYSFSAMSNKTFMGMIYAVDEATDDTDGIAYIVSNKFGDSYRLGYSIEGNSNSLDTDISALGKLNGLISQNISSDFNSTYSNVTNTGIADTESSVLGTTILYSDYTLPQHSYFKGKEQTKQYIDLVSTFLGLIYKKTEYSTCNKYITLSDGKYYFATKEDFKNFINNLNSIFNNANTVSVLQCVVYPFFYGVYLYEPDATEKEKATEAFKNNFSKTNWYVPSLSELATILYYRGYSAGGNVFSSTDIYKSSISTSITKGSTTKDIPVFSYAVKLGYIGNYANIGNNSYTISSTTFNGVYNYGYLSYSSDYSGSGTIGHAWIYGLYTNSSWGQNEAANSIVRWSLHQPIQCALYKFKKLS